MEERPKAPPHVLIFPLPAQGHVNSMLKLAELLSLAGIHVTFLNTDHNHDRLLRYTNVLDRFARFPGFQFKTIPDGLPADHPRTGDHFMELFDTLNSVTMPIFRKMLFSGQLNSNSSRLQVSCIIADGIFSFPIDVGDELGIPVIHFRTISACSFWAYFRILDIIGAGELPIRGNEDMDRVISSVPGMETFLRCRDLPSFCRVSNLADPNLQLVMNKTRQSPRASALILNTFEELEGPVLSHIRTHCPQIYTIGPLHALLKLKLGSETTTLHSQSSNSLFDVDRSCMTWLDAQPFKSVIYVSFGSITSMTKDALMEFWHGLVNSKKRFLWAIRPDLVDGKSGDGQTPAELVEGTKERGYMVGWAPQEEVLAHPAVGGFFTHSGWNSTLESIVAGVPMICWPYFADQQVNSRFVSEVWKLGMDMKDVCDRVIVEKMVTDLMVEKEEEFLKSTVEMSRLARESVSEGGSSYSHLDRLIDDIRLMNVGAKC
ncbi:7-deoxyloganetic acid glucosyl transferase-like [Corylus avellana]|uniref:7-deoxyloganetic acid glucosyl transferase-like n=1 Tax=Corylus avellana TaxID=13451 RepID=UPI00286B3527|nr:7-deoxyloganetic acid glucosyl transferase-like [Corylus avellana]